MPSGFAVSPDDSVIASNVIAPHTWDAWRLCTIAKCYHVQQRQQLDVVLSRKENGGSSTAGTVSDTDKRWEVQNNDYRINSMSDSGNHYRLLIRADCVVPTPALTPVPSPPTPPTGSPTKKPKNASEELSKKEKRRLAITKGKAWLNRFDKDGCDAIDDEVEAILNAQEICLVATQCIQLCYGNKTHACLQNIACSIDDPELEAEADKVCERLLGGKGGKGKGVVDNCYPENDLEDSASSLLDSDDDVKQLYDDLAARTGSAGQSSFGTSRQLDETLTGKEIC